MKVLIATNRLTSYSGSELVALEIAEAFHSLGHDVLLFTNAASTELLSHAAERRVPVAVEDVPQFDQFDLVWSQHFMLPLLLPLNRKAAGRLPFIVFAHLSPAEPYESPVPLIEDRYADCIFANSEETRDALAAAGLTAGQVRVFPNPAPASFRMTRLVVPTRLGRLLAVSNHLPGEVQEALEILNINHGVEVIHIGAGGVRKRVLPEDVAGCDAVLSIGKTVQYALLSEAPVYCYDIFGGPGWLNEANFDKARVVNFSGRCCRRRLTASEIADELRDGFAEAARFARELPGNRREQFALEPYVDSLIQSATSSRRDRRENTDLAADAHQFVRLRAMAQMIRREVSALEAGRKQLLEYEAGLENATSLADERLHEARELTRGFEEAQRLVGERDDELNRYAAALKSAETLAKGFEAEAKINNEELSIAQQLVRERDNELKAYVSALEQTEALARRYETDARCYAEGLREAERLVAQRDEELKRYAAGLEQAERLARRFQADATGYAEALREAQRVVAERDRELKQVAEALKRAEQSASESSAANRSGRLSQS